MLTYQSNDTSRSVSLFDAFDRVYRLGVYLLGCTSKEINHI